MRRELMAALDDGMLICVDGQENVLNSGSESLSIIVEEPGVLTPIMTPFWPTPRIPELSKSVQ